MIKPGIEKDGNKSVLIGVFNSGYVIALLLFLAGSIGSLCDGVIASRGLGVAELAAIGIVYPYTKTIHYTEGCEKYISEFQQKKVAILRKHLELLNPAELEEFCNMLAKQQLEEGNLGQDKYDALQREIIETEEELRRLQQEASNTSSVLASIDETGKKLEKVGDSITSAGKKVMPVSAAVAGVGAAAVKTSADFDSGMSQVTAVSGATGDDFDALRDKAREMGAKTKFSASEAAEVMNYMAMAGWKTGDMLGGVEGIMNLAATSGEDLATTSDIVTDALTGFCSHCLCL